MEQPRTMATVRVNTSRKIILYRDFIIEEAYEPGVGNVWEWTHEDYSHDAAPNYLSATGTCETMFECIEAVDAWHEAGRKALEDAS